MVVVMLLLLCGGTAMAQDPIAGAVVKGEARKVIMMEPTAAGKSTNKVQLVYEYDHKGKPVAQLSYADGVRQDSTWYRYNRKGKVEESFNKGFHVVNVCDFYGWMIESSTYKRDSGKLVQRVTYTHDTAGRVTKETVLDSNGTELYRYERAYGPGPLMQQRYIKDGYLQRMETYTYALDGSAESYATLQGSKDATYTYTYLKPDSNDNWTVCVKHHVQTGTDEEIRREIYYYK